MISLNYLPDKKDIDEYLLNEKKYDINIENRNEIRIKDCYENIPIFTDAGFGITFSEED